MYTALIVDDEPAIYLAINKLADWASYNISKVEYARDYNEALKAIIELNPSVIFLDIQMPGLNGIDLLKNLSLQKRHCAYIIVSGYGEFKYAQEALHYGASEYLLKPVDLTELNSALGKAMKGLYPNVVFQNTSHRDQLSAQEAVSAIKEYLDNHYSEGFCLQNFAREKFFSKEYLSRLFKKTYGIGITEYQTQIRMLRAKELLETSNLPLSELSERIGYCDSKYFSKVFRAYWGVCPSDFRYHD